MPRKKRAKQPPSAKQRASTPADRRVHRDRTAFNIGDRVIKNPATWRPSEFDLWGAGVGIGEIVEPPFGLDVDVYDVRWPKGRCFQRGDELLKVEDEA